MADTTTTTTKTELDNLNNKNTELDNNTEDKNKDKGTDDVVTMSKADFEKALQSASDKVRTVYSKKIKNLESTLSDNDDSKKEEPQAETLTKLEERLKALEEKEKIINMKSTLQSKNIDTAFVDFLKDDVDLDSFAEKFTEVLKKSKTTTNTYVPTNHKPNQALTKEQYFKMDIEEMEEANKTYPDLVKSFRKK